MADSFTERTQVGCFSRLIESIKGVVFGFGLIAVCVVVLFWGEGRAVHRAQALAEGKANVIAVDAAHVDPGNEGKLIHLSAQASSKKGLEDSEFGVEAAGALRLNRKVEMYQWKQSEKTETRKNLGGSEERVTTYTYEKKWSAEHYDSSEFKQGGHINPHVIPEKSESWNASDATLGGFELNEVVLDRLPADQPLIPPDSALEEIQKSKLGKHKHPVISQGMIYFGDASNPSIGDVRVSYTQLPSGPVSVVARQAHNTFEPFPASTGEVLLAQKGLASAEVMFKQAEEENAMITWIIRGVGFILIWIGFGLIFAPLATIADVVPFIGSIVSAGTFIVALICALPVWLVTVAVAWIFYRPLIGGVLILLAIGIPLALMFMTRKPAKPATA